jgi:hypothetical protein
MVYIAGDYLASSEKSSEREHWLIDFWDAYFCGEERHKWQTVVEASKKQTSVFTLASCFSIWIDAIAQSTK